jgi:hypothetical protein
MIIGKQFAEKLYSENQEEKLYSTGNDELDELLERAFCEGYELGQKEFAFQGFMNKIKAIPRHAKRDLIDQSKLSIDVLKNKDLNNKQLGLLTSNAILKARKAEQNKGLTGKLMNKAGLTNDIKNTASYLKSGYVKGSGIKNIKGIPDFIPSKN